LKSPVITYDAEANALYIRFSQDEIAETLELSRSAYLDVDTEGAPIGFEILHADPELGADVAALPEGSVLSDVLKPTTA
jgi:uncharacterized protein YuzE